MRFAPVADLRRAVEQLSKIPIVAPGTVVGVAPVIIALRLPIPLYGTLAIIKLASPKAQVMAAAMFDRWSSGQSVEVFALGMRWTLFMTTVVVLFYAVGRCSLKLFQECEL